MKKLLALLLTLSLMLGSLAVLSSCGSGSTNGEIRIGYLTGPTGMGMAKLIHDEAEKENSNYVFVDYKNDTEKAKADLSAGNIDVICLPTNEAAAYYAKNNDAIVLALNCLNSLFLVSDKNSDVTSLSDLEGKTVYTCKNGTPKKIIDYLVAALELNITVSYTTPDGKIMASPADVKNQMVNVGDLPYVVLPEPIITSAALEIQKNGITDIAYSVDVDLADEWSKVSSTPVAMGCIVASRKFVKSNERLVDEFLDRYEDSVEFVGDKENLNFAAKYVAEAGIMAAEPAAKKALSNLGDAIDYLDEEEMKAALSAFFGALGIATPNDDFYYFD